MLKGEGRDMDSGNSGSLQSSSGGDEEYESRATAGNMFMTSLVPPPPPAAQFPPQMFDPLANYMQQLHHQNANNSTPQLLLNPNLAWARPNHMGSDPDNSIHHQQQQPQTMPPAYQAPASVPESGNPHAATAARNPKKRSRASRRAPTTVLTTDTTNFRAMVQEFTGIPAPPFSNSSFPRSRLDIFGTRSTAAAAALEPQHPPPFLRRPFAQKPQSPGTTPFLASSTTTNSSAATGSSLTNPINNYHNFQNPLLSSLLQSNPNKFMFSGGSSASKPLPQRHAPPFEIPLIEEFGLGHGNHVTAGLTSLIHSDHRNEGGDFQAQMRPVNGGYTFQKNPSSPNFHSGEKGSGQENIAAARGEGTTTVESWICSSE